METTLYMINQFRSNVEKGMRVLYRVVFRVPVVLNRHRQSPLLYASHVGKEEAKSDNNSQTCRQARLPIKEK